MRPATPIAILAELTALLVAACGKSGDGPKSVSDLFPGVDCKRVKLSAEPDLVVWDAQQRAELDRLRKQGVVAVRYAADGCDVSLELISACVGPRNKYVYSPINVTDSKVAHDANELFAKMPLGAANVAAQIHDDKTVRADMQLVGSVALPPGSVITEYDLVGPECRRATHVISAVYVGGFALGAGKAAKVESAKNLFLKNDVEPIAREGDVPICDRSVKEGIELGGCSAPLRVALTPLEGRAPAAVCPGISTWNGTRCVVASTVAAAPDGGASMAVFDDSAVERIARSHQPTLRRGCWDAVPGTLKRIDVTVTMRVDTKGRVTTAAPRVNGADGPSNLAQSVSRCIASDVQTWQFPEPETEKTLTLPFHLLRQ